MTDHFDVYMHRDRVAMPAQTAWVVTIIRDRDARMQQYGAWDHQFQAAAAGDAVGKAIEFAGARSTLHPVGEHPDYDRMPVYPEPCWDLDVLDGGMERREHEQERDPQST